MIAPNVINAMFSDDQVRRLKRNIYAHYNSLEKKEFSEEELKSQNNLKNLTRIEKQLGRSSCTVTKVIPDDVLNDLINSAEKHGEIDWYNFLFVRYSSEFGIPVLGPHMDEHSTNFAVNYQLDSNIDWDIVLEDTNYSLDNNSALVFSPSEIVHWREPRSFKYEEFVDMVLFYFVLKGNNKNYSLEEKEQMANAYKNRNINEQ